MRYYKLCLIDQPKSSWVLHDVIKRVATRKNPEMPSAFYAFFAPPDADVHMKERYQPMCCPRCGRHDSDAIFEAGFEEPSAIRFKQDIAWTDDRQLVMNDRCLGVLQAADVRGYETKPVGRSGWHVVRVTARVDAVPHGYEEVGPNCDACGLPKAAAGLLYRESQLSLPATPRTFFTPRAGTPSARFKDREVFLTDDVYQVLKDGQIKGPYLDLLFSDAECAKIEDAKAKGSHWVPKGAKLYLGGK